MKKSLIVLLAVSAMLVSVAGVAAAASRHATAPKSAPKMVMIVMHDPGCHWFSVGGAYKTSLSVKGPVSLMNMDEATLKVAGPKGLQLDRVGKKVFLGTGTYRITMVGQAPDDNHLKLVVR